MDTTKLSAVDWGGGYHVTCEHAEHVDPIPRITVDRRVLAVMTMIVDQLCEDIPDIVPPALDSTIVAILAEPSNLLALASVPVVISK